MARRVSRRSWGVFVAVSLLGGTVAQAHPLDALVVTSATADVATTEWALRRPGMVEANPLLPTAGARVGAKVAATTLIVVGAHELEKRHHRGWAKAIRILAILGWSGAAMNNAIQARGAR